MRKLLGKFPLPLLVVLCLTLGLAPFTPLPHLLEKLKMLVSGGLVEPIDIFLFVAAWRALDATFPQTFFRGNDQAKGRGLGAARNSIRFVWAQMSYR